MGTAPNARRECGAVEGDMKDSKRNRERTIRDAIYAQERDLEKERVRQLRKRRSSQPRRDRPDDDRPDDDIPY